MKRTLIFTAILSLLCTLLIHAQSETKGTDFWLTFGRNMNYSSNDVSLQIRIVGGERDTRATITYTNTGSSISFPVPAGKVLTYEIFNQDKGNVYNTMQGTSKRSVRVQTEDPVSVYAFNHKVATADATNILPVKTLGTDYYHISYQGSGSGGSRYWDAYSVIATQNNTKVYHNGILSATLNIGEVYYRSDYNCMTGSYITADKPVAYFAMAQGTVIPDGSSAFDCLFQQLAPVQAWGKNFFVPVSHIGVEIIRIVASQNNTTITQTGGTIRPVAGGQTTLNNLNAGQFIELEIKLSNKGCYIQANKPIGVCTYLVSYSHHSASSDVSDSDPAQSWVPSIEQITKESLFAPFIPFTAININKHYALIITPTATKNDTRIKIDAGVEQPLSGGEWYDNGNAKMSFYFLPLTASEESAYLITNPEGLLVMGYGIGRAESYYYLASSAMRPLDARFYANDVHYEDLYSEIICIHTQPIQFRAEIDGDISTEPEHIKWYVNDMEEVAARDQLAWSKSFAGGTYRITMVVRMYDNITTRTIEGTITIKDPILDQPENIALCAGKTSPDIIFSGTDIDSTATVWKVTAGSGTGIGLTADEGTGKIPSFTAINSSSSDILITVTVTPVSFGNCTGESKTFTITVYNQESLIVNLGNDTTICRLDSLLLEAGHPNADTYLWHDASTKATYIAYKREGQYWVILKSRCNQTGDTINVTHYKDWNINLGNDITFCEDDVIYRKLNATTPGATSYLWQDGSTFPIYVAENQGIYSVTVSNVCMSVSDEIEIKIKDCSVLEVWIPNAFTPGEDGLNDLFKPEVNNPELLKEYEMAIYNRWGNLIFITRDYQTGWNGKDHQNRKCNAGIYVAVINYKSSENQHFKKQTSITLLR